MTVINTTAAANTFIAGAVGDPAGISATTPALASLDGWTINEEKDLRNGQGASLRTYLE